MARKKRDAQSPAAAASNGGKADPAAPKKKRRRNRSVKEDKAAIERAEKKAAALDFRRQGYTYAAIAAELGISAPTAHRYVQDAIAEIPQEAAEEVRTMMIGRLDAMMSKCYEQLDMGEGVDAGLFEMILKLDDRRARLLGIYRENDGAADSLAGALIDRMAAAMKADAPILRPDGPIPASPVM